MIITPVSSSPAACRGAPSAGVAYGITECLPFVKVAKTIRKFRDGILAAIRLGVNNAPR